MYGFVQLRSSMMKQTSCLLLFATSQIADHDHENVLALLHLSPELDFVQFMRLDARKRLGIAL